MSASFDFNTLIPPADFCDADLLDLIERFSNLTDYAHSLIERAGRFKEGSRAYNRLWREVSADRDERFRLEQAICARKAQTTLGVIAKLTLWLEIHADNTGTMMGPAKGRHDRGQADAEARV